MKLEPQWITGFVDGEGCFHVGMAVHAEMTKGLQILPEFNVVQHKRDEQILYAIKAYFGCGVVRKNHGDRLTYRVRKFEHLTTIIAPFFMKHTLKTKKHTDFKKFCRVLQLMEKKLHLREDGIEEIRTIANQMNVKGINADTIVANDELADDTVCGTTSSQEL